MQILALYKDSKGEKVFEKVKESDVLRPSRNTHSTVPSIDTNTEKSSLKELPPRSGVTPN